MAGPNPLLAVIDFDLHYIPNGVPDPDSSACGNADEHRSELKRNDSYREVFSSEVLKSSATGSQFSRSSQS